MSHTHAERFIRAWQKASSAKEVAKELGISHDAARQYAYRLRKMGVPLKKLTLQPADFPALAQLAKELET